MALYLRRDGRTDWAPKSPVEKGESSSINLGHHDPEKQFVGTVNSTARILNMLSTGSIEEEDFYKGLSTNAQHIGVSEETLLQLAEEQLEQDKQEKKA